MTSSLLSERLRQKQPSSPTRGPWLRVAMGVLATIGLLDTASITLKRWGLIGSLTCPGGSDGCDKVLGSAWGTLFGQPLSLYGALAYGLALVLALAPLVHGHQGGRNLNEWSQQLLLLLCTAMAGFSLVLVGLMLFTIKAICAFCVLSAALCGALFLLSVVLNRGEDRGTLIFRVAITGVLVFLIGLGWASLADQPVVEVAPVSRRRSGMRARPPRWRWRSTSPGSAPSCIRLIGAPIATTRKSFLARQRSLN